MCKEMYQEVRNKDGSLKHSHECQMSFGRKDEKCPRCVEMLNGAAPRSSWQKNYFEKKKALEIAHINAIRNHNCQQSGCMSVCTFGEW